MAKIDWSKHRYLKLKGETFKDKPIGGTSKSFYLENKLWHIKGKYYGTHYGKLPLQYLNWVVDNLDGVAKQLAIDELYRRFAKLSNT